MAKDARGAVVSVRISETDQQRLRHIADTRGTSVSEIVRTAAMREAGGEPPAAVTVTVTTTSRGPEVGRGATWDAPDGAFVNGTTLTI